MSDGEANHDLTLACFLSNGDVPVATGEFDTRSISKRLECASRNV